MPNFLPYTKNQLDFALRMIEASIYPAIGKLNITAYRTKEPVSYSQRQSGEELHLKIGDTWGELFDCAWFHFTGRVPETAPGKKIVLLLDVSGEMCVFDEIGVPQRGLTNVASDYDYSLGGPGKRVLPLFEKARGGEEIDIWADAGANDLFGNLRNQGRIQEASIAICQTEVRKLFFDFEVLLDFLKVLPEDTPRYQQVLQALNDCMWRLASTAMISNEIAEIARQPLQAALAQKGGDPTLNITAIGHAHIDLGWLWPIRETHRKGARTFATVLANMERYPDYVFGASQPQLLQWIKDEHPELYAKLKQKAQEGRFEPQGAMWVEADTNLTGSEALVRQILYGKRFWQDEFGIEMRYLWLPDVFGYSAALPQILKKSGVDYFMTQKMSWNQVNKFPHHSFHWQGIDGSSVMTHMLPEETYNSSALPRAVNKTGNNYFDKGVSDQALLLFGIGDGGGGPGEEHLERLERLGNLAGLFPVKQAWAADFFETWKKDAQRFPTWVGELYLERHAGTLTTEAKNKWYNRRIEEALRELEFSACLYETLWNSQPMIHQSSAGLRLQSPDPYPADFLEKTWKEVLLYQFHDILPGSSIKRVYDESLLRYAEMLQAVESKTQGLRSSIAENLDTRGMQSPAVCFNSLSWEREAWVKIGENWLRVKVPPLGYTLVEIAKQEHAPALNGFIATKNHLENELLRVNFAADGTITSVFDKQAQREAIRPGQAANRLAVYRDHGDAWDFPMDYATQTPAFMQLVSSAPRSEGPRLILKQVYKFGHSEMVQEISLESGRAWLEFDCRLSWRETASMLRTSFPVNVHAEAATFEIQFGSIQRATHRNTTWDLAKDEVAAHKFADLSQGDFGVALLNDCKYGYKVKDGVIDLNLLRSVPYPRPTPGATQPAQGEPDLNFTDQAEHVFRYALYPHRGNAASGDVVAAGYEFNYPLAVLPVHSQAGGFPPCTSLLEVDASNVIVETIKKAEDGTGLILRLYEACHAGVKTEIKFGFPVSSAWETDLLENPIQELCVAMGTSGENQIRLEFAPYEIKTIAFKLPNSFAVI
jgi:alpha-mannosidase